jgi:hypothetical protein
VRAGASSSPTGGTVGSLAVTWPAASTGAESSSRPRIVGVAFRLAESPKCERPDPGPPRARSGRAAGIAEASVRLGVTLATERQESRQPTQQRLPLSPGDEHSGAAERPIGSTFSQVHAGCKQKSGSIGAVDQTAASGAKQPPARPAQDACWLGLAPDPASAVTTVRAHRSRRRDARWPIFVVGLVLIGIGIAIRQWVVALVGQFLTIDARVHSGQTVVEKRPCRWCAHGATRAPAWAPEAASNAKSPGSCQGSRYVSSCQSPVSGRR